MEDPTEQRAEFTEQIETRINEIMREFQDLELEQMRKGEIKARAKLANIRGGFVAKRKAVKDQLEQARKASSAAWADSKQGLESAWDELRSALEEARREFSDTEEQPEAEEGSRA